jgi:pantetheine-phosphate adenylyltransferase
LTRAVYPGTFDPVHNGHVDIATRAAALFDELIVAIYDQPLKSILFSTVERMTMMEGALKHLPNATVASYRGLTVDFARERGAQVIVRGLRVISDFELEYQMALTNRQMAPDIDSVCLMTDLKHAFLSSRLVKEIAMLGGPIEDMVPPHVAQALRHRVTGLGDDAGSKIELVSLRE